MSGFQGERGHPGAPGTDGPEGPLGAVGMQGAEGDYGDAGPKGVRVSAYSIPIWIKQYSSFLRVIAVFLDPLVDRVMQVSMGSLAPKVN